jgi:calcium-dependent protein kinase
VNKDGDVFADYEFDPKILGEGTYGVVFKAREKDTDQYRAIKRIAREKIRNYQRFLNEINALKTLDHPNVIKLFEIYEDKEYIYLVQEYLEGGELFEYIVSKEYLDEVQTARIFKQIISAILYCHKNAIWHRDLKPENFMFVSNDEKSNLKLIDFGLSWSYYKIDNEGVGQYSRMQTTAGTAYFMAPEVLTESYNSACDMWSIGVILYIMLWGYPPFDGETEDDILKAVQISKFDFNDKIWQNVSEDAKDLISSLLVSEDQRLSPKEALKHPWIIKSNVVASDANGHPFKNVHMNRLKKFHKMANFKKVVLTFIASRTTDKEILEEMKAFSELDKNKDGYITVHELRSALKGRLGEEEIKEILDGVDTDKNGAINYTEFIAATLNKILVNDKSRIKKAFSILDKNGDGSINATDLAQVLSGDKMQFFDSKIVTEILDECDLDKDGSVTFEEFHRCITMDHK